MFRWWSPIRTATGIGTKLVTPILNSSYPHRPRLPPRPPATQRARHHQIVTLLAQPTDLDAPALPTRLPRFAGSFPSKSAGPYLAGISISRFSSIAACSPLIRSRFGACHTPPACDSRLPPVKINRLDPAGGVLLNHTYSRSVNACKQTAGSPPQPSKP